MLLKKRKDNKSSPRYEKELYQVMACQVQFKSPESVELKRNIQQVNQFVILVIEPKGSSLAEPVD